MNEQKPSVGRVVHFVAPYVSVGDDAHRAATIAHVNADGTVNLGILDRNGKTFSRTNIPYDEQKAVCTWHWPERV